MGFKPARPQRSAGASQISLIYQGRLNAFAQPHMMHVDKRLQIRSPLQEDMCSKAISRPNMCDQHLPRMHALHPLYFQMSQPWYCGTIVARKRSGVRPENAACVVPSKLSKAHPEAGLHIAACDGHFPPKLFHVHPPLHVRSI